MGESKGLHVLINLATQLERCLKYLDSLEKLQYNATSGRHSIEEPVAPIGSLKLLPTGSTGSKEIWLARCESDRRNIHPITLEVFRVSPFQKLFSGRTWEIKPTNWRNVSSGMSGFVFMTSEESSFTCDRLFTSNKADSITIKCDLMVSCCSGPCPWCWTSLTDCGALHGAEIF